MHKDNALNLEAIMDEVNLKALERTYMRLIHEIPDYGYGVRKQSRRRIQKIMHDYEYDEDTIETISDEFCQGFGTAKEIILKLMREELDKQKQSV